MKLLLLPLFLVCTHAGAAEWILTAERNATSFYIDVLSVKEKGQYRSAWIMLNYREHHKLLTRPKVYYRSAKQLQYFDCSQRTSAVTQAVFYAASMGKGGSVEKYTTDLAHASFSRHLPDTPKDRILKEVCGLSLR